MYEFQNKDLKEWFNALTGNPVDANNLNNRDIKEIINTTTN